MRTYLLLAALCMVPAVVHADTPADRGDVPPPPTEPTTFTVPDPVSLGVPRPFVPQTPEGSEVARPRRHHRDRFSNTLSLGVTIGAGSPLGIVGAFAEYRPIRYVALAAGGGLGGAFGPALGGTLYLDPLVTRGWALGVAASLSHNFSLWSGEVVPGRPSLPSSTDWASFEVQTQVRPSRHWFVRVGVGYGLLLNTQAFHLASEDELNRVDLPDIPGTSPVSALHAAARNETLGVWYVHLDIAPIFRL